MLRIRTKELRQISNVQTSIKRATFESTEVSFMKLFFFNLRLNC